MDLILLIDTAKKNNEIKSSINICASTLPWLFNNINYYENNVIFLNMKIFLPSYNFKSQYMFFSQQQIEWFYSTVTNSQSLCRLSWPGDREGYLPLPLGQWVAKRILGNRRPSTREGCEGFWLGNTWGESHTAWSTPEILLIIKIHVNNLINSFYGLY